MSTVNIDEEREKNRQVLDEWIAKLFWDDGQIDLVASDGGTLEFKFPANRSPGGDKVKLADAVVNLNGQFEEWIETPIEVFETDDPTHFMIYFRLGYGRVSNLENLPLHESEFVLLYIIENQKISLIREYFNPLQLLHAYGVDLPGVKVLEDEAVPEYPFY